MAVRRVQSRKRKVNRTPSQKRLQELFVYDPDIGTLRWRDDRWGGRWGGNVLVVKAGSIVGWIQSNGRRCTTIGGKRFLVRRLIWKLLTGKEPPLLTTRDLREATPSENAFHRGPNKNNTSGVRGVSWKADKCKWEAFIVVNRSKIGLGYFDSIKVAARVRRRAELKYFPRVA